MAFAPSVWPLLLYFAAVILLIAAMIGLSAVLGERNGGTATGQPFESGIVSVGSARLRFPARFYLVAMFFVIFDLEAVFLFAWAIALREAGWAGFGAVLVFAAALISALAYLWRLGALDWGPGTARVSSSGKG
jgi:NADH-quinone oxidoreductase subunit A